MAAIAMTAVTPKPGTKFYHGHGHHHFEEGRAIHLPTTVAERLVKDGLVDLAVAADGDTTTAPAA